MTGQEGRISADLAQPVKSPTASNAIKNNADKLVFGTLFLLGVALAACGITGGLMKSGHLPIPAAFRQLARWSYPTVVAVTALGLILMIVSPLLYCGINKDPSSKAKQSSPRRHRRIVRSPLPKERVASPSFSPPLLEERIASPFSPLPLPRKRVVSPLSSSPLSEGGIASPLSPLPLPKEIIASPVSFATVEEY